tara:strand:- start:1803 stop:1928 length:126 start_codon:yes stop_codon:yes gene_type:complete
MDLICKTEKILGIPIIGNLNIDIVPDASINPSTNLKKDKHE